MNVLLISERPREFRQFALPRLTFLYRFYPMIGDELGWGSVEVADTEIVSESDLRFAIANQCNGHYLHIPQIKDWAKA